MELCNINSFDELVFNVAENAETEIHKCVLLSSIYQTVLKNETWIGLIIDYLNQNEEGKIYSEYYLTPFESYGTRECTFRFISIEENMPFSITDEDIRVIRRVNKQTDYILYDFQEQPSLDPYAYLDYERTLIDVLRSIGMPVEVKKYLVEYCFGLLKENSKFAEPKKTRLIKKNY